MKTNTNQDFAKWVATLTQDRKKFNFNKIYKVLRRVDKEDKFRLCVKQLAIDWRVPLPRLTDEHLRPYRRECTRADSLEPSATETSNEQEVWEVLNESGNNDGSTEGISQDHQLANTSLEIETLQGNSLQDNILICETSPSILHEEKSLLENKDKNNHINLKVSTGNPQSSLLNKLEDINLQGFSNNNVLRNSLDNESISNFTFENALPHNSGSGGNYKKDILLRGKTPSSSTEDVILQENSLSKDEPFDDNNSVYDLSRDEIINHSTVGVILQENSLPKDKLFKYNDSKDTSVADVSRVELTKHNTVSVILEENNLQKDEPFNGNNLKANSVYDVSRDEIIKHNNVGVILQEKSLSKDEPFNCNDSKDNSSADVSSDEITKHSTVGVIIFEEKNFLNNDHFNDNNSKDNSVADVPRDEITKHNTVSVILEENNLKKDEPFNGNDSKANSVYDVSRDEIIKHNNVCVILQENSLSKDEPFNCNDSKENSVADVSRDEITKHSTIGVIIFEENNLSNNDNFNDNKSKDNYVADVPRDEITKHNTVSVNLEENNLQKDEPFNGNNSKANSVYDVVRDEINKHSIVGIILEENNLPKDDPFNENNLKENSEAYVPRDETIKHSTGGVNLEENNLTTNDPFNENNSKDSSLVDVPRNEIIKHSSLSHELQKESAILIKWDNDSLNKSKNNCIADSLSISEGKYLVSGTLKNIDCQEEDLEEEKRQDELCFSDDSGDFESAARGLTEALELSENDVTSIKRKSITTNTNTAYVLINEESDELQQRPLPKEIDENTEHIGSESIQSKKEAIYTNIEYSNCRDSSANQESNESLYNITSQAFPLNQQHENPEEDKTYASNMCLQFANPSNENKKANQVKEGKKDKAEMISSQIVKSVSSKEFNLVSVSNICCQQPVYDGKVKSTEKNTNRLQNSLHEKNMVSGKVVESAETVEEDVIKREHCFCSSKQSVNTKLEMCQVEIKYIKPKEGTNSSSKTEEYKINTLQACIAKEAKDTLYKTSLGKDKGNEINISDTNNETKLSFDETRLVQNWWTKYQFNFKNEKMCSFLDYPKGILDYDSETWPEISNELNGNPDEPEKEHINSLLSELEDLEREKNIISTLQESTSESELEASEEISDGENMPPAYEKQATTNVLASKIFQPTETNPDVPILNIMIQHKYINVSNTAENGTPLQDIVLPIQPPLPSYPPPRTPSPPPFQPISLETLLPASPPCSPSSLSVPHNELSQEKQSTFLSNIPLPASAPAVYTLEKQQLTPLSFKTCEAQKIPEPLSSSLTTPTLNKRLDSKHLEYSSTPSESESKLFDLPSKQKIISLFSQKTKPNFPLSNSESQEVLVQVLSLQETLKCKPSSSSCIKESRKSGPFLDFPLPRQVFPMPSSLLNSIKPSSSLESVKPPSLSAKESSSSSHQYLQGLKEGNITDSVTPQKLLETNVTTQETKSYVCNGDNFILCRNTLKQKNLYVLKCWKLKNKCVSIKHSSKKSTHNKPYICKNVKVKKKTTKVLQNKCLLSSIKKNLVLPKQKFNVVKNNHLEEESFNETANADSTHLPVGKVNDASNESNLALDIKGEFSSDMTTFSFSNLSFANEKSYCGQLIPGTVVTIEKEDTSFECSNEDCFPKVEQTADMSVESSEDIFKSPSTEENKKECMVPTIVSVVSSGIKSSQITEVSEEGEFENEDNKFRQFVDESIPGDPIACKYVEDEENIEISFEPIGHNSTNLDLKVESPMLSTEPVSEKSSMLELNHNIINENYLLTDLQVSSSDDESEEECYIRPRIINGFGDPFIIPRSQEEHCLAPTKDNVTSSNLINIGYPKFFQDHDQLSTTLPEECTLTKHEDGMVVSSKLLSHNLQESNTSLKSNVPVSFETKSIKDQTLGTMKNSTNPIKDKSKSKSRKQIENKRTHLNERKPPLKPKNQVETPKNGIEKKTKKSSSYKNIKISENVVKIRETNAHKLKISKSMNKMKLTENKKRSQDIIGNTTKKKDPVIFKNRHDKTRSPKHKNNLKTDSYVPLNTDDNAVAITVCMDTNFKNRHKTTQNGFPSNVAMQKEKSSYQPSNIRKRLTSEVENIIPIKKYPTTKSQIPIKTIKTPLKRTYSLPEEPSVKILNPVVDSIVKDMDASPPPKSLVIKQSETQKYVAQAYRCNHSSTFVGHNSTNTRDVRESPFINNDLNNQNKSTPSNGHSVNKRLVEGNIDSKNTLKRSISLNSDVINKKENIRNLPFKPKKPISFLKGFIGLNKTPQKAKRSSDNYKNAHSIKHSIQNGEQIVTQEILKLSQSVCNSKSVVDNRKIRESLPSMPLIEFQSRLDSSSEKPGDTLCKTVTAYRMPTAIGMLTNVPPFVTSHIGTNKPSIKVSIPISHFTSLYGELTGDSPPSNKNKIEKHAEGNLSHNHSRILNKMGTKTKMSAVKTKSKGLENLSAKEILYSQRNIHLNKAQQRNEVTKERPNPMKSEENSKDHAINSSSSARSYEDNVDDSNVLVVSGQKLQSKTIGDKSIQRSSSCLKRCSTEPQSECPTKQNKVGFDNVELHDVDFNRDVKISSVLASCLDKEKGKDFTTPKTSFSGCSPVFDDLSVLTKCNVREANPTNSERCEQLETSIPHSPPLDEVSLKILKDLANINNLQISMPQKKLSDLNVTPCETSKFDGEISKKGSLTLRVKHPSSIQTNTKVDMEPQQLPKRRISVISPEALSSGVQSNNYESVKRHTWYMEPVNISTKVSSFPSQDQKVNNCNATSLFCNLLDEPSKTTELINMFQMSVKIGKKEYERMHDVIRCIELDYKQKQDVIESVKKLQSRDVVKQEIKRATDEYENKLAERGSFFRKTFSNLLDHFKGATDYVYLAFYVFLSQKVVYLCSEPALKDSLFGLLKSWIRNDLNKHVFDQSDNAFSNDCEIILNILRKIENFSHLLSGVNASILNQREGQLVDFSLIENSSQENGTIALITTNSNKDTVEPTELDFSLGNSLVNDLSEPHHFTSEENLQTASQSRPSLGSVEQSTNLQPAEFPQPSSEFSTTIEPRTTKSANPILTQNQIVSSNFDEPSKNRELQKLRNSEIPMLAESRTAAMTTNQKNSTCTNTVEHESITSSQELIQQENTQFDVPNNTSQYTNNTVNVLNNSLQPQFLAEPDSQNSNVLCNEYSDRHKQTQGLSNVWNKANVNVALGPNNNLSQMALRDNINSKIHNLRQQVQHETPVTKYSLSNPLVSQTNNTIDKYQSMRRGKEQSHITNHTTNSLHTGHNVIPSTGPDVARQTFVGNVSSLSSLSYAQNIGPYNCGVQSGISQPLMAPSVYPVYPQSQTVQGKQMQQHPNNIANQNTEIGELEQICQTQRSYQDYQPTSLRTGQIIQPVSNYCPVQPSQHQLAQYVWGENTTQQLGRENHNLAQGKITNNVFPNEVTNQQPLQYLSNNNPDCSQSQNLRIHQPINPQQIHFPNNNQRQVSQQMSWQQKYQSGLENQFNPNTDTSQFGNIIQDMLTSMSDASHTSSQIMQNIGQNVQQHVLPRRFSNDDISTQPIKQPLNQSFLGLDTSKRQYHYQKNASGNTIPGSRRSSIETTQPSQQTSTQFIPPYSSSNQHLDTTAFSVANIHQNIMNRPQREEVHFNVPVNQNMVQMSSGHVQSRRKSIELSEPTECNSITEADLDKLFSLIDSEKIMELMESAQIKDNNADIQNENMNLPNLNSAFTNIQTSLSYDDTKKTALLNIDKNFEIIAKMPNGDLNFNGVNITKEQLLKFVYICRQHVYFGGLREDQETTFIGQYTTADGRVFTQDELIYLMKGLIAMNAQKITRIKITKKIENNRSKVLLIKTLKLTAFKDVSSYLRIIDILKGLAQDNDKDAQQAVQEIVDILRIFRQPEQIVSSNPVIVIDD